MLQPKTTPGLGQRTRLYDLLIDRSQGAAAGAWYDGVMVVLTLVNVLAVVLDTVPEIKASHGRLLIWIDFATLTVITIDYLLRLWLCTEDPAFGRFGPLKGRLRYGSTPLGLIDLVAIVPYWLNLYTSLDLRVLLLLRLLRVLKLARYSPALSTVLAAVASERKALGASLLLLLVVLVIAAGVMHYLEGDAQPVVFGTIPRAMWWAIATLTTVGYGDVTPVTMEGRIFAGITALFGIMVCAVPAGLMASAFVTELRKRDFVVSCRLVAKVPIFQRLDTGRVADIAGMLQAQVLPPGHLIVHQGDRGDRVYFIVEGEARVKLDDRDIILGPGDFFGEMALLYDEPRNADVVTASECRLLYLDREPFLALMVQHPDLAASVHRIAERRHGRAPDRMPSATPEP